MSAPRSALVFLPEPRQASALRPGPAPAAFPAATGRSPARPAPEQGLLAAAVREQVPERREVLVPPRAPAARLASRALVLLPARAPAEVLALREQPAPVLAGWLAPAR
ncbi:hypothetical protein EOD10_37365, partial [Mesorhizobium sp. M7A.T.Ca.TU.009.01.3.2]